MTQSTISAFKRFFHWGPFVAIGIIKCVTLTTLYMNSMLFRYSSITTGTINQIVFMILSSITIFNYSMATSVGPGYLPKNWKPKKESDINFLQYCGICEGYKAPRSHHCRKCNRCVKKMDHHCPWINNCVGWQNQAYFTYFLCFAVLGCIHATFILAISFYRGLHRNWYIYHGYPELAGVEFAMPSLLICIFSLGLSIGVVIAVGMLLFFQLRAIWRNRTGIEDWILEKARYRRCENERLDAFIFPYDLGRWNNFFQVINLTCYPVNDGISWPLKDGCHEYSLTVEQISQKNEKRARTRIYRVVHEATGSYIPLFSQGLKISMSPPCTDEQRIKLQPNDLVRVTRWRPHWLFGEKVNKEIESKNITDSKKLEIKGWFPRRCAIEIIYHDNEFNNDIKTEENLLSKSKKMI